METLFLECDYDQMICGGSKTKDFLDYLIQEEEWVWNVVDKASFGFSFNINIFMRVLHKFQREDCSFRKYPKWEEDCFNEMIYFIISHYHYDDVISFVFEQWNTTVNEDGELVKVSLVC